MRILYLPSSYSQQRQFQKKANIYPVRMAMEAEYRRFDDEVHWWSNSNYYVDKSDWDKIITEPENLPFLTLPKPNRIFTDAKSYTSGNYKFLPGTHIMSASGCPWAKCEFCIEKGSKYEVRSVEDVISEIEECKSLGFAECFDDSATFPVGEWLDEFCKFRIAVKDPLPLSCNMRIDAKVDYKLLKQANFRMLLYGIESANQSTLDRIQKGVKVEDIIPTIKKASQAGLEPHICVIFGHPNETDSDAINTLKLVHYLLRKGYAKTAQASFYQVAGEASNESHRKYISQIYNAAYHFDFWFNKLRDIHGIADVHYIWKGIKVALKWCA